MTGGLLERQGGFGNQPNQLVKPVLTNATCEYPAHFSSRKNFPRVLDLCMLKAHLLIPISIALLAGCDANTSMDGHVVNAQGQPIQDASVWLIYADRQPLGERTDSQGAFSAGATHSSHRDQLTLLVSAPNYKLHYQLVTAQPNNPLRIVLQPGSQAELSVLPSQ